MTQVGLESSQPSLKHMNLAVGYDIHDAQRCFSRPFAVLLMVLSTETFTILIFTDRLLIVVIPITA